jgi:FlaA1/EpsC-like NDP-sugar epimerase
VYWLDMGAPVRIGDLAERFITYVTPAGQPQVRLEVIGLRPGEKMCEELTTQGEVMQRTAHPCIWSARQRAVHPNAVAEAVRAVRRAVTSGAAADGLAALQSVIEFEASPAAMAAARTTQETAVRRFGASEGVRPHQRGQTPWRDRVRDPNFGV